jgi:hypothetical protein
VCLVLVSGSAVAQEFRATITGRVVDPSGLVLPGVLVTARNVQTNETATSVTNDAGLYTVPFLNPGTYTITAELAGFKTYVSSPQALPVGQTATLNVRLEFGAVTETVTVVSEAADTSKADRGKLLDSLRDDFIRTPHTPHSRQGRSRSGRD